MDLIYSQVPNKQGGGVLFIEKKIDPYPNVISPPPPVYRFLNSNFQNCVLVQIDIFLPLPVDYLNPTPVYSVIESTGIFPTRGLMELVMDIQNTQVYDEFVIFKVIYYNYLKCLW